MTAPFGLDENEPSAWARLSKDYNPIHVFPLAARLFGFKGKIAHGNHVVAKGLGAIVKSSPKATQALNRLNGPCWIEVSFRRPVIVPSILSFGMKRVTETADFEVLDQGKVCIEGRAGTL